MDLWKKLDSARSAYERNPNYANLCRLERIERRVEKESNR